MCSGFAPHRLFHVSKALRGKPNVNQLASVESRRILFGHRSRPSFRKGACLWASRLILDSNVDIITLGLLHNGAHVPIDYL